MVFPALEAATPPPLVQFSRAPVQALNIVSRSVETSTQVEPQQSESQQSTKNVAELSTQSPLLPSTISTESASLGGPLSLNTSHPAEQTDLQVHSIPSLYSPHGSGVTVSTSKIPSIQSVFTAQSIAPVVLTQNVQQDSTPETSPPPRTDSQSSEPTSPSPKTVEPVDLAPDRSSFVELSADRQEYDTVQKAITAVGNVLMSYRSAQLKADRVQTLTLTKRVIAEGNVQLTQGNQTLQGDRLEYFLDQERGFLYKPRGIIYLPSTSQDLSATTPATNAIGNNPLGSSSTNPPSNQPSSPEPTLRAESKIERLRFEADRIEFNAKTWTATNIRITSDPFSPPELEVRADQAQATRISSKEDIVTLKRPRLVFDQGFSLPIPRSKIVLSRQRQNPFSVDIGYDDRDRGGIFLGRQFTPISSRIFTLSFTPQILVQRTIAKNNFNFLSPDAYGLGIAMKSEFSPKTTLTGFATLRSADLTKFGENVRAGLRLRHWIKDYRLDVEEVYRERILNGSLEEQTIQNRAGVIFSSPTLKLSKTGIEYNYRLAGELITAQTDAFGDSQVKTLGRLQGSVSVQRAFELWKGRTLPATATEGLRYTPEPIQPSLKLVAGLTGVVSGYTNGDSQSSLIGKIRLEGQFGHFSRPYLDYTSFYVGFSQGLQMGTSPFLFDRFVDQQVVSAGFLQQVYGPIRIGLQSSLNLESGEFFDTDIVLDYSRRTYGISLHYNPNLQVGSIVFRINSFNWVTNRTPLSAPEVGVVKAGVGQNNEPF